MHKISLLLILLLTPLGVFAEKLDVIATPPSGKYNTPIHITLTPTQSGSKTFYSFKPDGYPQDTFLYEKPILLKHSSPFIYFSVISTSNESKIKQNDYIIEYSGVIHFQTEIISGSGKVKIEIVNNGTQSVNIGYWYIQSESDMVTIPEDTMITPWAKQSVYLNYSGKSSIVLRSPDDDERDILIPEYSSEKSEEVIPKKEKIVIKTVPRTIISTKETTVPETPLIQEKEPVSWVQVVESKASTEILTPTVQIPENNNIPTIDINRIAKASVTESWQDDINPLYFVGIFALSFWAGVVQWYMRRRQK